MANERFDDVANFFSSNTASSKVAAKDFLEMTDLYGPVFVQNLLLFRIVRALDYYAEVCFPEIRDSVRRG